MTWFESLRREWGLARLAVQVLTRLPVGAPYQDGALRACVRYFPLVGVLVGLVVGGVQGAARLGWPPGVAALLAAAVGVLLTGGLHEDGLADCCDGLFGGRTCEDALRIMRDSRIGVFGALGLALGMGLKVSAMTVLGVGALVAAAAVSRFWMAVVPAVLGYARTDGMAAGVMAPGAASLAVAAAIAVVALAGLGGAWMAAVVASGSVAAALMWWVRGRLGGYTGDVLGAVQLTTETAVLLAASWHAA